MNSKTSLIVGFKGEKAEVLFTGAADKCHDFFEANRGNTDFTEIGFLRKPKWHKRDTPVRNEVKAANRKRNILAAEEARAKGAQITAKEQIARAKEVIANLEVVLENEAKAEKGAAVKSVSKPAPAKKEAPAKTEAKK